MTTTWHRPKFVPYPTVWSKFTRVDKNGAVLHFEIQDITEDLFPACIDHMTKYFLPDEPMYTCLDFLSDPTSVKEQQDWWKEILPEKMSLVCLLKDDGDQTARNQIAGINLQYYHHKSHDDSESELKGEKLKLVCDIVKNIEGQADCYKLLKIEEYMDEFGLSVHPDYRCMGIGTELLNARCKLGKTLGLNASITVFTSIASQKAADRAGYKNLVEIKFSDFTKLFPPYVFDVKDTPTVRYMYKLFSDT